MTDLPWAYIVCVTFIFGVVIGSFLNVYIYRFHTGKSLSGSSHCLSCGHQLSWYDLFPILSYLILRGRCRTCSAYIPSRYFWVELVTGLSFVLVLFTIPAPLLWPVFFAFVSLLVVIVVYDIYHMIIPDAFVAALCVLSLAPILHSAFYSTAWIWSLVSSATGALLSFCFFAGLWYYSGGRWIGFGDAKLAVSLGALVGLSGVFSMIVLSFWIGTIISLGVIIWQRYIVRGQLHLRFLNSQLTIHSEVPFAPFLILGFVAVYFGEVDVLTIFQYVL